MRRTLYLFLTLMTCGLLSLNAQTFQVDSLSTSAPTCPGGEDGAITVFASSALPNLILYSIDGTNFQSSNMFTVAAGDYTVTVLEDSTAIANPITQEVTVAEGADTIAPSIICPEPIVLVLDDDCRITVTDLRGEVTATDNCTPDESLMIFQDPAPPITVGTGVSEVIFDLFAMDASGNFSSCPVTVTTVDQSNPDLECPSALTVDLNEDCGITIPDLADSVKVFDNCTALEDFAYTSSPEIGTVFSVDTAVVTFTVEDESGNTSSCNIRLNAEDRTAPSITCPGDFELSLNEDCRIEVPELRDQAVVSDNCTPKENIMVFQTPTPPLSIETGVMSVTFKLFAMDEKGNFTNCEITVSAIDEIAPTITCPEEVKVNLGEDCANSIPDFASMVMITDNCTMSSTASLVQSLPEGTAVDIGSVMVGLTVADESGNTSSCEVMFTVTDELAPEAVCKDIVVALDENGKASLSPKDVDGGSFDNCTVSSMIIDNKTFDCGDVGENIVSLTLKDASGNLSACRSKVTIVDDTAPEVDCKDIRIKIDADTKKAYATADMVKKSASDVCGIQLIELSQTEFDCGDLGRNREHLKVMDKNGNQAFCKLNITVEQDDDLPSSFSTASIGDSRGKATFDPCAGKFYLTSVKQVPPPTYNNASDFNEFTYVTLSGNFTFRVRVDEQSRNNVAGIMVRSGAGDNAAFAYAGINNDRGTVVETGYRATSSATDPTVSTKSLNGRFFTVSRSGNTVTIRNGNSVVLTKAIGLSSSAKVGFFVTARQRTEVDATFGFIDINNSGILAAVPGLDFEEATKTTVKAYPNPVSNELTIEMGNLFNQEATLRLFNVNGQEVLTRNYATVEEARIQLDVSGFRNGIYFLSIESIDRIEQMKIVIE